MLKNGKCTIYKYPVNSIMTYAANRYFKQFISITNYCLLVGIPLFTVMTEIQHILYRHWISSMTMLLAVCYC